MRAEIIVTRRVPTFDFVVRTDQSVRANSERLERYIAEQPRPKGFVLHDPRLDGTVFGGTFELRQHNAWMWGSMIPEIEGEIIPNETGSDVVVQVRHGAMSLGLLLVGGALLLLPILIGAGLGFGDAGAAVFGCAVLAGLAVLPVIFHGVALLNVFASIFASTPDRAPG